MNNQIKCVGPCGVAALLLLALVASCAQPKSALMAVQDREPSVIAPASIQLNLEDVGNSSDTSALGAKLAAVFSDRIKDRTYKPDWNIDQQEAMRIEKTVFVEADRSIKLAEVANIVEALRKADAGPVLLPIYNKGKRGQTCFSCALELRGSMKLSPLTLLIGIKQPGAAPARDSFRRPSISDLLISAGLPIRLCAIPDGEPPLVITIAKEGDFTLGQKHVAKAALARELEDLIKSKPATERAVFIKAGPAISYGSLEDAYLAAFSAGATLINLDTGTPFAEDR